MAKKINAFLYIIIPAMLFVLCLRAPAALAAGATSVWVNGVELTASAPYWENGSATASGTEPAGGYNAYFNSATATLTLNDAVVNTPSVVAGMGTNMSLIHAQGDISVTLSGANAITFSGNEVDEIYGFVAMGALTINGDGSADVHIVNDNAETKTAAIWGVLGLTVHSGTLSVLAGNGESSYGLYSDGDILFEGGEAQLKTVGLYSISIFSTAGDAVLSGGKITATSETNGMYGIGVFAEQVYMAGMEGSFTAYGTGNVYGMANRTNEVVYTGGDFTFSGSTSAMGCSLSDTDPPAYLLGNATVKVSLYTDGSLPAVWTAATGARLVSNMLVTSDFHYARIYTADSVSPQTGDASRPWLWAGIAGLCLVLGAAGILAKRRSGKRV